MVVLFLTVGGTSILAFAAKLYQFTFPPVHKGSLFFTLSPIFVISSLFDDPLLHLDSPYFPLPHTHFLDTYFFFFLSWSFRALHKQPFYKLVKRIDVKVCLQIVVK